MTCDLCNDTGYVMQDIGTATVPDYVEIPCRCNPEPMDADAPDWTEDWADWDNVPGSAYDDFHPTTYLYGTE